MTEHEIAAIQADRATLKPRERASMLTDAQERLLYEAVPTLLAEVARLQQELTTVQEHNRNLMDAYTGLRKQIAGLPL